MFVPRALCVSLASNRMCGVRVANLAVNVAQVAVRQAQGTDCEFVLVLVKWVISTYTVNLRFLNSQLTNNMVRIVRARSRCPIAPPFLCTPCRLAWVWAEFRVGVGARSLFTGARRKTARSPPLYLQRRRAPLPPFPRSAKSSTSREASAETRSAPSSGRSSRMSTASTLRARTTATRTSSSSASTSTSTRPRAAATCRARS